MIVDSEAYLEHYGVKGMKWGVRKSTQTSAKKKYDAFFESAKNNPTKVHYVQDPGSGRIVAAKGKDWVAMHTGMDGKFTKWSANTVVRRASVAEARLDKRLNKRDAKRKAREAKRDSKGG